MLMAAGVVVLAAGVWWGLVAGDDDGGTESERSAATVSVRDELDLVPGCTISSCRVLARRGGFRFEGRVATLAVVGRAEACRGLPASGLHLVAEDGVLWSSPDDLVCGDPVAGIEADRTGNALLVFEAVPDDPDAAQALVVRFEGGAVEDFGSFDGRFRGAEVRTFDVDGDGAFEILVDGETWRWDGEGYRAA